MKIKERKSPTGTSSKGMVSTASAIATQAGVKMLEAGGNAIDAAVASAFCLGVTEPQASGIGGQSMVLLHLAQENRTIALDGSSRSPYGLDPRKIPDKPLKLGIKATTLPSTPATLGYLLETYGTMPLSQVLEPAIEAAQKGFPLSALQHSLLAREKEKLSQDPLVKEIFFRGEKPLNARDIVFQPQLANCLRGLAIRGWRDFYLGEIAQDILKDMDTRGGLISQADLRQIPLPIQRDVLRGSFRDYEVLTFPPPGAGRALIQILNILEAFSPQELAPSSPLTPLIFALTFREALMNRERMPMDPALYPQTQDEWMLAKETAKSIAARIRSVQKYYPMQDFTPPPTAGETTHLSVADSQGNIVGITQSIELLFGSKTMAQGLGFFYNNYMSAFNYRDMMHPFYLLPGEKPWSSVAPTLLLKDSKPFLILGSPGSERISTALAQVITRVVDANEDLAQAIAAPRIHAGSSGKALIEKRFPLKLMKS